MFKHYKILDGFINTHKVAFAVIIHLVLLFIIKKNPKQFYCKPLTDCRKLKCTFGSTSQSYQNVNTAGISGITVNFD